MAAANNEPCPFRFIDRGRTFCAIAITDRAHTTTEVNPRPCSTCEVPRLLAEHGCAFLSLGVEIDEFGGRFTADVSYAACESKIERLFDLSDCREGGCPAWRPLSPERVESIRERARERHERFRGPGRPYDEREGRS